MEASHQAALRKGKEVSSESASLLPPNSLRTTPGVRNLSEAHAMRLAPDCAFSRLLPMRRKPWTRAIGAFLATWFTLVANEHAPLNPCPMHGDLLLAAVAPVESHSHGDATPAQTGHDHADGKCSCAGDCASQQLTAPELSRADRLFLPIVIGGPIGVSSVSNLPTAPPFLRPFANGPPHLRIG